MLNITTPTKYAGISRALPGSASYITIRRTSYCVSINFCLFGFNGAVVL